MADQLAGGMPDIRRIDVRSEKQVQEYAERFGISRTTLIDAVTHAGSQVDDVINYLRGQGYINMD